MNILRRKWRRLSPAGRFHLFFWPFLFGCAIIAILICEAQGGTPPPNPAKDAVKVDTGDGEIIDLKNPVIMEGDVTQLEISPSGDTLYINSAVGEAPDSVIYSTNAAEDSAGNNIIETYLPFSGGTMTGEINMANNVIALAGSTQTAALCVTRLWGPVGTISLRDNIQGANGEDITGLGRLGADYVNTDTIVGTGIDGSTISGFDEIEADTVNVPTRLLVNNIAALAADVFFLSAIDMYDNDIKSAGAISCAGGAGDIISGFDEVEADTITINSVPIKDFEGTGLSVSAGVLSVSSNVIFEGDNINLLDGTAYRLVRTDASGNVATDIDYGTSGQVLTSQGTGSKPIFATIPTAILEEADKTYDTARWIAPNGDTALVAESDGSGNTKLTVGNESDNSSQVLTIDGGGDFTQFTDSLIRVNGTDGTNNTTLWFVDTVNGDSVGLRHNLTTDSLEVYHFGGSWAAIAPGTGGGMDPADVGDTVQNHIALIDNGTQTGITVTYQSDSTIDFVVSSDLIAHTLDSGEVMTIICDSGVIRNNSITIGTGTGAGPNDMVLTFDPDAGPAGTITYDGSEDDFDFNTGLDITGNITITGTVDGVDIANGDHGDVAYSGGAATVEALQGYGVSSSAPSTDYVMIYNGDPLLWRAQAAPWLETETGDISRVTTNGTYLTGGAQSGNVDLLFDRNALVEAIDGDGLHEAPGADSVLAVYVDDITIEISGDALTVKAIGTSHITNQTIGGDDVDSTSENFAFDGAYHVTTNEADSAYVTANTVGDSVDALRDGDTWTGAHDFGGASLEIPNGTNPTVDAAGEIAWETDDTCLRVYDGAANRAILTSHTAQMAIDNPDNLTNDSVTILDVNAEQYPFGIEILGVGLSSRQPITYSVSFENFTHACVDSGTEGVIEVVAATTACSKEDDGTMTNTTVAAGSYVKAILPATDVDDVNLWVRFYVKTGD